MKLLLILILFTITANAQSNYDEWKSGTFVDEFGDNIEEKYEEIYCKGTFDNSATSESKLTVSILKTKNGDFLIDLYEYNSRPGAIISYEDKYITLKVKDINSKVHELKVFASSLGGLFLSSNKKSSKALVQLFKDNNKLTFFIRDGTHGKWLWKYSIN